MEKLEHYRHCIQKVITDYASIWSSKSEIDRQLIFDPVRDHYQLVYVGWKNRRRQYGSVLHLDLKDGKIWLQNNGTEVDIGEKLMALGVPKEDIVLGFQEPLVRPYTGYGVG